MTLNEFLELLSGGSVETSRQYCPQCKRIYFDKSMTYDNCFFCHANLLQKNVIHSWKYKEIWSIIICFFIATCGLLFLIILNDEWSFIYWLVVAIPYSYAAIFTFIRNTLRMGSFSNFKLMPLKDNSNIVKYSKS